MYVKTEVDEAFSDYSSDIEAISWKRSGPTKCLCLYSILPFPAENI